MSDRTQIAEALERWDSGSYQTPGGWQPLADAARAYEQGTTRRWCEIHDAPYLELQSCTERFSVDAPCRIVEVRVSPLAEDPGYTHRHEWIARNEHVTHGEICLGCGSTRP